MPHKDEQSRSEGHRLTAEEVGARVGAILGDAERVDESLLVVVVLGDLLDDLAQLRDLVAREDARDVDEAVAVELLEDLALTLRVERRCRGCAHRGTA